MLGDIVYFFMRAVLFSIFQMFLSIFSMVGGFAIYYIEYGTTKQCALWPIASSMVFAIAPYTLIGMMPLNYQLLDTEACIKKGEVYSTSIIKDAFKNGGGVHIEGQLLLLSANPFTGCCFSKGCNFRNSEQSSANLPACVAVVPSCCA